ncbi:MAG: hypothetical protein ACOC1I_01700 [Spirochaetota bacterium]
MSEPLSVKERFLGGISSETCSTPGRERSVSGKPTLVSESWRIASEPVAGGDYPSTRYTIAAYADKARRCVY